MTEKFRGSVDIAFEEVGYSAADFAEFKSLVVEGSRAAQFNVSERRDIYRPMMQLDVGRNIFFEGEPFPIPGYDPRGRRAGLKFVSLPRGVFSGASHAVLAEDGAIYAPSIDTGTGLLNGLRGISKFDSLFRLESDEEVSVDTSKVSRYLDIVAVPISGPGYPNFGHFLYDGLPTAIFASRLGIDELRLIGSPARRWQLDLLQRLGMADLFVEAREPTRARVVLASSFLYGHLPFPSRFVRIVFDLLRMTVRSSGADRPRKVFISRGSDMKRPLVNRANLEKTLEARGYLILDPLRLSFDDMVRAMSSAALVVGEGGAGLGNVGFCESGTCVLEIQRPTYLDGWTRATCDVLGLDWSAYILGDDVETTSIDTEHFLAAVEVVEKRALID